MIRLFDIILSGIGLIFFSPLLLLISIWILIDSKGPIFYKQTRVGKNGIDFNLIKFRSMFLDSQKDGLITVGAKDPRVTSAGYYIRKYKIDELPQLINVLIGNMSLVGPRPEVRKYVELYLPEQIKVISVKPGVTDYASIKFVDENELLSRSTNPEKTYIEEILPLKISFNMIFINNPTIKQYFIIIFLTIKKIFTIN